MTATTAEDEGLAESSAPSVLRPDELDPLRVTVLGCSGSYPGPGRACSGYLVEGGGVRVVLDLGSGALANLLGVLADRHEPPVDRARADASLLASVDAVVLSHEHPDHWSDLTGLRVALRYGSGRTGLPVYLTAGTRRLAEAVCGDLEPPFAVATIADGDVVAIGGLTLSFAETDHYVPTLACRIADDAHVVGYSADTGPGWSMGALGPPVDLALVECSHLAEREDEGVLHLSARQAGRLAAEAGARRLVLTHLVPGLDADAARSEAASAFGAPVAVAEEGATFVAAGG